MGNLDPCAVEEVWEVGVWQTGANIPDDLPPALADLDAFDPWATYLGPASEFDP